MATSAERTAMKQTHTAHKRQVNELIFESLAAYPPDGEIGFFCECPSEVCFETVWMPVGDYERARLNPRWCVIRSGHRRPQTRPQSVDESSLEVLV
jgi:hypothetical protein